MLRINHLFVELEPFSGLRQVLNGTVAGQSRFQNAELWEVIFSTVLSDSPHLTSQSYSPSPPSSKPLGPGSPPQMSMGSG